MIEEILDEDEDPEDVDATGFFLTTRRLGFRSWRADDLELALALWTDPRVTRFLTAGGALSRGAVLERLDEEIALEREHGTQYWPMFLLQDRSHAGVCGLRPRDPAAGIHELGCHVRPPLWGRGLATEASRAMIVHAFETLGASALFAGHNPANEVSRHLLLGLGFRHTHDEPYPPTGLRHPSYLLQREAWEALRDGRP